MVNAATRDKDIHFPKPRALSVTQATEVGTVYQPGELKELCGRARAIGLHVHMGHGLNYLNTPAVVRIPGVEELNIGHAIVSRAVFVGMREAVREMKLLMHRGPSHV